MNEHANDTGTEEKRVEISVLESSEVAAPRKKGDLVVDLSGVRELDFANLALLLTAQQKAEQEDRDVWLAGVPINVWQALNAMGLGQFFKPFPVSREVAV